MKRARNTKANLVIKEHNPWRFFLWLVIAMILVSVGIALSFEMGYIQGDLTTISTYKDVKNNQDLLRTLNTQIKDLNKDNNRLRTAAARLESQNRIDAHAHHKVKDSLIRLQKDNLDLREELDFYRGILLPKQKYSGLKIHSFKIDQGSERGLFYYKLTVIQVHGLQNRHRITSGAIRMYISGRKQDGSSGILTLKDLAPVSESNLKFSIKYMSRFEGRLNLPPGFSPKSVRVQVLPKRRRGIRGNSIEKRIEWPFKTS